MQTDRNLRQSFEAAVLAGFSDFVSRLDTKPERRSGLKFLAALSGGADSSAMTAALAAQSAIKKNLHVLHVNHGIRRPESCAADQETAAALCKKLDIPFNAAGIPSGEAEAHARQYGTGIEGAARHFRYKALWEEAARIGADAIVTGHTADDRLETILMAFLRGSGPAGLGAMAGHQRLPGGFPVIRPLLSLSRADVLEYLRERQLSFCTDETNDDQRFFRNRIRLTLIPFLDQHFPYWRKTVLRLGETQAMTAAFLAEEAEKRIPWKDTAGSGFSLSAESFFSQPEILREEALFLAMDRLAKGEEGKNPRRETIRSFAGGKDTASDVSQFRLEHKNDQVTVKTKAPFCQAGFSVLIKSPGIYKLEELAVTVFTNTIDSQGTAFFCNLPLVLRSPGDGTILAEDQLGRVALIQDKRLVWKREFSKENTIRYFAVQLNRDGGSP